MLRVVLFLVFFLSFSWLDAQHFDLDFGEEGRLVLDDEIGVASVDLLLLDKEGNIYVTYNWSQRIGKGPNDSFDYKGVSHLIKYDNKGKLDKDFGKRGSIRKRDSFTTASRARSKFEISNQSILHRVQGFSEKGITVYSLSGKKISHYKIYPETKRWEPFLLSNSKMLVRDETDVSIQTTDGRAEKYFYLETEDLHFYDSYTTSDGGARLAYYSHNYNNASLDLVIFQFTNKGKLDASFGIDGRLDLDDRRPCNVKGPCLGYNKYFLWNDASIDLDTVNITSMPGSGHKMSALHKMPDVNKYLVLFSSDLEVALGLFDEEKQLIKEFGDKGYMTISRNGMQSPLILPYSSDGVYLIYSGSGDDPYIKKLMLE